MTATIDIAAVWAFIIAFAVFVYVVMDGFDLGLGLLFPLFPAKADRDVAEGRYVHTINSPKPGESPGGATGYRPGRKTAKRRTHE